jgi:multidrug efflux pump
LIAIGLTVAGGFMFTRIGHELMPLEDRGYFYGVAFAPQGATLDYTDTYVRQIEALYKPVPEIKYYLSVVGVPSASDGLTIAVLKDWHDRKRSQFEVARSLGPSLLQIPGVIAVPVNPPSLSAGGTGKPVQIVIRDSRSWAEIAETAQKVVAKMREFKLLANPSSNLQLARPAFVVTIDRMRAADLGIDVSTIASTLESLVGGRKVSEFEWRGRKYPVNLGVPEADRGSTAILDQIFVRSRAGTLIALADLIQVRQTIGPKELEHFDRNRSVTISANLAPGASLGDALAGIPPLLAPILPPTASLDYAGASREYTQTGSSMIFTAGLALLVIYLVLAAQFESFIDPLIILTSVPVTLTGALGTLYLTGTPLSVFGEIGLITLVGLISKHGILIVEFANRRQEDGLSRLDAIREAATMRLRPILMTSAATVLGAIPLAIASGAGAISRVHIGLAIVGGLTFGSLITIFLVPAVYSLVGQRHVRKIDAPAPVVAANLGHAP